jgi:hypothetical protein
LCSPEGAPATTSTYAVTRNARLPFEALRTAAIHPRAATARVKSSPGPPATLGSTAEAHLRLIVWCRDWCHQVEPDPAEMAERYPAVAGRAPAPVIVTPDAQLPKQQRPAMLSASRFHPPILDVSVSWTEPGVHRIAGLIFLPTRWPRISSRGQIRRRMRD